jgi:hypothetical protein
LLITITFCSLKKRNEQKKLQAKEALGPTQVVQFRRLLKNNFKNLSMIRLGGLYGDNRHQVFPNIFKYCF